jgi:hypothetical protein
MIVFERETEAGPVGYSAGLRGGVRSSESVQICWVSIKGCHIRRLSAESVCVAYVDRHKKCACPVYQVSPAGCTLIRITVTLEYEYHLFMSVIT